MKKSVLLFTLSFSTVSMASPRDCESIMSAGLAKFGIKALPPTSSETTLQSIDTRIADAKAGYEAKKQTIPPATIDRSQAPKPDEFKKSDGTLDVESFYKAQREFEGYKESVQMRFIQTTAPFHSALRRGSAPLEFIAMSFRMDANDLKKSFDRIEEHKIDESKSVDLFMSRNRIAAFRVREGESYTNYALDSECNVTQVTTSFKGSNGGMGPNLGINKTLCAASAAWAKNSDRLPSEPRKYEDACSAVRGTVGPKMDCRCPSDLKSAINPWLDSCGYKLPENAVYEHIFNLKGYVMSGHRHDVQDLKALCDKNTDLFGTKSSEGGILEKATGEGSTK